MGLRDLTRRLSRHIRLGVPKNADVVTPFPYDTSPAQHTWGGSSAPTSQSSTPQPSLVAPQDDLGPDPVPELPRPAETSRVCADPADDDHIAQVAGAHHIPAAPERPEHCVQSECVDPFVDSPSTSSRPPSTDLSVHALPCASGGGQVAASDAQTLSTASVQSLATSEADDSSDEHTASSPVEEGSSHSDSVHMTTWEGVFYDRVPVVDLELEDAVLLAQELIAQLQEVGTGSDDSSVSRAGPSGTMSDSATSSEVEESMAEDEQLETPHLPSDAEVSEVALSAPTHTPDEGASAASSPTSNVCDNELGNNDQGGPKPIASTAVTHSNYDTNSVHHDPGHSTNLKHHDRDVDSHDHPQQYSTHGRLDGVAQIPEAPPTRRPSQSIRQRTVNFGDTYPHHAAPLHVDPSGRILTPTKDVASSLENRLRQALVEGTHFLNSEIREITQACESVGLSPNKAGPSVSHTSQLATGVVGIPDAVYEPPLANPWAASSAPLKPAPGQFSHRPLPQNSANVPPAFGSFNSVTNHHAYTHALQSGGSGAMAQSPAAAMARLWQTLASQGHAVDLDQLNKIIMRNSEPTAHISPVASSSGHRSRRPSGGPDDAHHSYDSSTNVSHGSLANSTGHSGNYARPPLPRHESNQGLSASAATTPEGPTPTTPGSNAGSAHDHRQSYGLPSPTVPRRKPSEGRRRIPSGLRMTPMQPCEPPQEVRRQPSGLRYSGSGRSAGSSSQGSHYTSANYSSFRYAASRHNSTRSHYSNGSHHSHGSQSSNGSQYSNGGHSSRHRSNGSHSAGYHSSSTHSASYHSHGTHSASHHTIGTHSVGYHTNGVHSAGYHSIGTHYAGHQLVGPQSAGYSSIGAYPAARHSATSRCPSVATNSSYRSASSAHVPGSRFANVHEATNGRPRPQPAGGERRARRISPSRFPATYTPKAEHGLPPSRAFLKQFTKHPLPSAPLPRYFTLPSHGYPRFCDGDRNGTNLWNFCLPWESEISIGRHRPDGHHRSKRSLRCCLYCREFIPEGWQAEGAEEEESGEESGEES